MEKPDLEAQVLYQAYTLILSWPAQPAKGLLDKEREEEDTKNQPVILSPVGKESD